MSLDRLDLEHDNLRAALGWSMEHDTETALLLCHRLWRFWQRRGHLTEGLERSEAALALPDASAHPAARADALSAAAGLAYWRADADRARAHYGAEIEARTAIGDRAGLAEAEYGMSFTFSVLDLTNPETATNAKRHINAALGLYQELGDDAGIGRCEWALANVLWGTRNTDEARGYALHALELFEASGDRFMSGWAAYTVGLADLTDDQDATEGSAEARDDATAASRRRCAPSARRATSRATPLSSMPSRSSRCGTATGYERRDSPESSASSRSRAAPPLTRGTAASWSSIPTTFATIRPSRTIWPRARR